MYSNDYFYPILVLVVFTLLMIRYLGIFKNLDIVFLSREKKRGLKIFFSKHFHFFNQLSEKERDRFIIRAYKLVKYFRIIGRQDFKVTYDIKLFVVAAQVQLTFGFDKYILPKFRTILIYPDAYKNKLTGNMHYGEVNPKGVIVLSWKRLLKGHKITDDAVNLGLHEMAHALMHTIIHSNNHENGLDSFLRNIVRLSRQEMEVIKSNDSHLFRKYAGTNIFEFFAIAVEYFFEVPEELKNELPNLYQYLTLLLKQDPVKRVFRK